MSLQMGIVLVLVGAAVLYFGRGILMGLLGRGCASGGSCSNCGEGGCSAQSTLAKIQAEIEARNARQG